MIRKAFLFGIFVVAVLPASAQTAFECNSAGVTHYNAGQWADAIAHFECAYELEPGNPTVRRNLCNAHQATANELAKAADFAAAAKHLELAIAIDPRNYAPLVQLASYYLRLDFVPEAIFRLEEAIELAPESVDAHELLGDAYYKDNDSASALVQWEWVLKVQPDRRGLRDKVEKATRELAVESEFRPTGSRHFQLSYERDLPSRPLRRVLFYLERAYVEIGRNFGRVYPPSPVQVIAYDAEGFANATLAGVHVGALYDGKIRIPLVDAAGTPLDEPVLKQRLYHEYTHVVVRFLGGSNVPWWLNEGLAETFSTELGPLQMTMLERAKEAGALYALADLEGNQLKRMDADALRLAYAQSHATVTHLWTKFIRSRLTDVMSDLAQGVAVEESLRQRYGRTYAMLEKEVARTIGRR